MARRYRPMSMHLTVLALALTVSSGAALAAETCPVTHAPEPAFVLPAAHPKSQGRSFYVGTPKLWALVYPGPWRGLPLWPEGYRQKIVWWSEGYVIIGWRLDGDGPPMVVTGANGSWTTVDFIMSGVNFPTKGCWEITGRFKGAEAKFVVAVE